MKAQSRFAPILLLTALFISACNAPWLPAQSPSEPTEETVMVEPSPLPPTVTPEAESEAVALDPCTLLEQEEVSGILGGEVQVMPAGGTGGCSYMLQGESPTEMTQLIVSAAQGEEAKSLTLLSLGMLAGFSGDPSLQAEFESVNEQAASLSLIELIGLLGELLEETGLDVSFQPEGTTAALAVAYESETYRQATIIYAEQDTYVSINQVGSLPLLETAQLTSLSERAFGELPAAFYMLDPGSDGSIQIQIGEETAVPDEAATQEDEPEGLVWVGTSNSGQVLVIDPGSDDVLATIDAGRFTSDIAIEGDQVWVINEVGGVIHRFDPQSFSIVEQKDLHEITLRADLNDGVLWITGERGITQLNLGEGSARDVVYNRCYDIIVGDTAVWSSQFQDQQILKIDPETRRVTATVKFDANPGDLAYGGGMLWVVLYDRNEIVGVDPATDQVTTTFSAPSVIHAITFHQGKLWYTNPRSIHYVDVETMEAGSFTTSYPPNDIEIFDDSIWITSPTKNTIVRFNLETFKAEAVIKVDGDPTVIAAGD